MVTDIVLAIDITAIIYGLYRLIPSWKVHDQARLTRRVVGGMLLISLGTQLPTYYGMVNGHSVPIIVVRIVAMTVATVTFFAKAGDWV